MAKPLIAVCLFSGSLLATGCRVGPRNYANENDKLRSEVLGLGRTVEKLEKNLELRLAQIDTLEQRLGQQTGVEGVAPSDIPRVVAVEFDRLSGAIDTDGDGVNDTLRLYVKTVDHLGRFVPAIGPARVQVVVIRPGQKPRVVAERAFTPKAFEAAYRTGLTGTHYTLEVGLGSSLTGEMEDVTVKLTFTDAATGVEVSGGQGVSLHGAS